MVKNEVQNIVIIGAGNVATHLALALYHAGKQIKQVYSRTQKSAEQLAVKLKTRYTNNLDDLYEDADIYIFAVSDDAISELLKQRDWVGKLLVHTAGSVSQDIFKPHTQHFGVLYPLQTFSIDKTIDFSGVTLCIESNNPTLTQLLKTLASELSTKVYEIDTQQRVILHMAAVFACNFTNHMWVLAEKLLDDRRLDFNMITPLIEETFHKAIENSPSAAQTGPAIRNDKITLNKHKKELNKYPYIQEIYSLLSQHIYHTQNSNNNNPT